MPPKRMVRPLPFPVGGLHEGVSYEDQPPMTSVDVQNVRAHPANSAASGKNSESAGRARGGQRAGLTNYVGGSDNKTAHIASSPIQDMTLLSWSEITSLAGGGEALVRTNSGSYILIDRDGDQVGSNLGTTNETLQSSTWDTRGFGYIALIGTGDFANKLIIRKINSRGESQWDWTSSGMPVVDLSSPDRAVRGMAVDLVRNNLYVWAKDIDGVNGEVIYRVKANNGKLRDAASGAGVETDYWLVSQNQSTAKFENFYPSTGHDGSDASHTKNLMALSGEFLGMVAYNNGAPTEAATNQHSSSTLNYNATAAQVETYLESIDGISSGDVECTTPTSGAALGTEVVTVEFKASLALQGVPLLSLSTTSLSGGTWTIARSQRGNGFVNEKQTITSTASSGTCKLGYDGVMCLQLIHIPSGKQYAAYGLHATGFASDIVSKNKELDITVDQFGYFYTLSEYNDGSWNFVLRRTKWDGTQDWVSSNTGTLYSVAYDPTNNRLAGVGGNVYGSGHSFAIINYDTGARTTSQDAHSMTSWNHVEVDDEGGFRIFRNETTASKNIARMSNASPPVEDWISSFGLTSGTNTHYGDSVAAATNIRFSKRQQTGIAVCNGVVKEFNDDNFSTVENGGGPSSAALSPSVPVIFSAQLGQNIFFADGESTKYYDGIARELKTWSASSGTFPVDSEGRRPTLIENWRSRIVMSGLKGDPAEWFMSKLADGFNFNYTPDTITEDQAVAGVNSPAGKMPDIINSIIPVSDDILVFGGDHTLWMLAGDPMVGGRLDKLAEGVGTPWGRPWCQDGNRNFYLYGTRGGIYRGSPQEGVSKLTSGKMEERLNAVNLDDNLIRLLWNEREQGVHVFITPRDNSATGTHYFYDVRFDSWWLDTFDNANHNPTSLMVFDGDRSDDRAILLGGWDGYIRKWDVEADDDDGTAISSHVFLGPILGSGPSNGVRLNEVRCVLARNSDDVKMDVYRGDSAEDAYANSGTSFYTSTFSAGRNVSERRKAQAHALYLKMYNSTLDKKWALERVMCEYQDTSHRFSRIY